MSLVTRYGTGSPAPAAPAEKGPELEPALEAELVENEPAPAVVDDAGPLRDPAAVRAMFGGLGWSTTAPADEPAPAAPGRELEAEGPAPARSAGAPRSRRRARRSTTTSSERARPTRRADALAAAGELDRLGIPHNAVTGEAYRGNNIARVLEAELVNGYGAGGWAGFHQWREIGRTVRKGEKCSCRVVAVFGAPKGSSSSDSSDAVTPDGDEPRRGGGITTRAIFHYSQTDELATSSSDGAGIGAESEPRT